MMTFLIVIALMALLAAFLGARLVTRNPVAPNSYVNALPKNHDGRCTKLADAAITQRYLLYKVGTDANHIAVAGATDQVIGTVDDEASAAEDTVNVNLLCSDRTHKMVAAVAITAGIPVYQAASGKIDDNGTRCVGIALSAASADGDVIEVMPRVAPGSGAANLIYAAIYTWADTNASNTISLTGLGITVTDMALATVQVTAGSVTAITTAKCGTDQLVVVLNAAGTTAVKVGIAIYRPVQ